MKSPLLSVVIPVYNVENFLSVCLDSVLAQTLSELEIICVNDGSTDKCEQILQEYANKDKRIRIITQENSGLSSARNTGIKAATCDYITFLDSDDFIASDFYQKLYDNAINNNADISCGNTVYYTDGKTKYNTELNRRIFKKNKNIYISSENKRDVCTSWACWNKIYRRNLIINNNLKFYNGKLVEDFPFTFLICALSNKIVCDQTANLYYRQHSNSIMKSKIKQCALDVVDNCEQLRKDFFKLKKIKNDKIFRQTLDNFIFDQCIEWASRAHCTEYNHKLSVLIQKLTYYSFKHGKPLNNIMYKCLNNKFLKKLFHLDIGSNRINFWFLKFLPVFKIRCHNCSVLGYLFLFIPVHIFYKTKEKQ